MEYKIKNSFLPKILSAYVLLIGMGLPIFVRNQYYDILVDKYYFYLICTISMITLSVAYIVMKNIRFQIKDIWKEFTVQDYAILLFLLTSIVATLSSDYFYESFWGNEGRLNGLFLLTLYVISYFFVSRFCVYHNYYIDGMLAVGMFVCLFGITDYFQMDILRFKVDMLEEQKTMFTSTLGNINTYTSYVGMIMAISSVLFATCEGKRKKYYYICMIISFFAIIMGVSDNAYISCIALFGLLPLYLFFGKSGIKSYLVILASFLSVVQITAWINIRFSDIVIGIEGVFNIITEFEALPYMLIGLWALIICWNGLDYRRDLKQESKVYGKRFQYIWLMLILLIVLLIIYALYDCNVLGNVQRYGSFGGYLVFNDGWGTHRGYIWRNAMEVFSGFSFKDKLIGFGPETFGILLMGKTYGNPYNSTFDAAHNEYLHLLLTIGIVGVTSYVVFLLFYIKKSFSCKAKTPYMIAMAFGVICYSAQATVNLSVPVVTPILWLILGMGTALFKENS